MKWIAKYPDYAMTFPLAVLCGLLAVGLVVESLMMQRRGSERPSADRSAPVAQPVALADGGDVFVLPAVDEFSDFVERPLFVEGRKPPPEDEQKQAAEVQDTTPLNLKLMGVMFSPSGELAILAEASGKNRRVRKGGTISGWRLVDLKTDHVTVQRGEERRDLALLKPRPKAGGPGQPPGSVPGGPPSRRGAQPPPEAVEPTVEEMEDTGDPEDTSGQEDLSEAGDAMPEGEE
ncbi:MAG: hypothetical protein FJ189_01030 [Gammaproteobacteria bacterium]|nr:hypothetical protein [Gammaproteobacteria bacterium]